MMHYIYTKVFGTFMYIAVIQVSQFLSPVKRTYRKNALYEFTQRCER